MNVKTSFFNPTIYKKTLMQTLPFWVTYLFVLIMSQPYTLLSMLKQRENGFMTKYGEALTDSEFLQMIKIKILNWNTSNNILIVHIIFAAVFGLGVFRYLYNNKFIGTIHALPVRRECLFITNVLAGVTMFAMPQLLCLLLSQIVGVCFDINLAPTLGHGFVVSFVVCLISFSIAALAAILCGHTVSMPIIYLFLSFFAVGAEALIKIYYGMFTYGYIFVEEMKLAWLSPIYKIVTSLFIDVKKCAYKPESMKMLIVYLIVSVVILGVALILYHIRHTEHCNDALAFHKFQSVIQVAFAWVCSWLGVGLFMQDSSEADLILNQGTFLIFMLKLLFVSFAVYLIIKMILDRSIHIIKTCWTQGVIFAAVSVVIVVLLQSDPLGYEAKIPRANEVKTAVLEGRSTLYLESEEGISKIIELQQACLENKEEYLNMSRAWFGRNFEMDTDSDQELKEYLTFMTIRYELKNGNTMERHYPLIVKKNEMRKSQTATNILCELEENGKWQLESLQHNIKNPSQQLEEMNITAGNMYYSNISGKLKREIYNEILNDLKDGKNLMQFSLAFEERDIKDDEFLVFVSYTLPNDDGELLTDVEYEFGYQSICFEYVISPDCNHSYELIKNSLEAKTGYEDAWSTIEETEKTAPSVYERAPSVYENQ